MMRKLAVTVFALSLAALGCGSDSGTKTPDAAVSPDGQKPVDTTVPIADGPTVADAPIGVEAQAPLDTAKVETPAVAVDSTPVLDVAQGADQAPSTLDTGKVDSQVIDTIKPAVDSGAPVDSGSTVDSGKVDGGTVG